MRRTVEEPVELEQVKAQVGEAIENAKRMVEQTAFFLRTVGTADSVPKHSSSDALVVNAAQDQPIA